MASGYYDFSSAFRNLNSSIDGVRKRWDQNEQKRTLAELGQQVQAGNFDGAAQKAFALGDAGTGLGILKLGQAAKQQALQQEASRSFLSGLGGGAAAVQPGAPSVAPASLVQNESGGNWQAQNNAVGAGGQRGHFGRLQFGQARLQEAAAAGAIPQGTTPQAFMASPELQQRAEAWHFNDIDNHIRQTGLDRAIGQTINGVPITLDGMRAVAHLGGKAGLSRFVASGGRYNPADENGTRLSDYLARHGGAGTRPVQVAETEEDVQRLEAQQAAPVQVAQAPGGPQADMPAQGASPAQGFAIPQGANPGLPPNDPAPRFSNQALMEAQANPNLPQAQREMAKSILERRLRYSDENSPLKTETLRLQNEKARRDLQGEGAVPLTAEERKQFGISESQAAYKTRNGEIKFGPAGTNVTFKNEGTIPSGYRAVRDAAGNVERIEAIPGSEAASKEAATQEKVQRERQMRATTSNTVLNALDDIDMLMKNATLPTTGALGARLAGLAGTAAHDIKNAIDTISGNISFDKLNEMRAASPTGGALGGVTERELELLSKSAASLAQSQSEAQFKSNLGRVRALFERTIHGKPLTEQERKAGGPMTGDRAKALRDEASQAIANGAPREAVIKRLKEQYGIDGAGL